MNTSLDHINSDLYSLLNSDLINILNVYAPRYKLLDFFQKLFDKYQHKPYCDLSYNPNGMDLIIQYKEFISFESFSCLSTNSSALDHIYSMRYVYVDWQCRSENPALINLLMEPDNRNHIFWEALSQNPAAMELLSDPNNREKISWFRLSTNKSAFEFLTKNQENIKRIDWVELSGNPAAFEFLMKEENKSKINWSHLCKNPAAINLLTDPKNKDRIDFLYLVENPAAINYLIENCKYFYNRIWRNPNIFEIIYF